MEQDNGKSFFSVGSLIFKNFDELYENIKGRTDGFSKAGVILHNDKAVSSFNIKYEKPKNIGGKERFVVDMTKQEMMMFTAATDASYNLRKFMPKMSLVGCSGEGFMASQKYFGYYNIKK